ncbi:MAG: hypothetical protein IKW64_01870 [Clostridia bacterium]|nr:hypothetical protein [Clostridia bacterium]
MKEKSNISPKTKKILVGVGVVFGTVMAFLISFILAFTLIVNPINFMTVSDADTVEENEKLKEQVQTLEDEVELLNTTVDKYKNSAASQSVVTTPAVTTPPAPSQSAETQSGNTQTPEPEDTQNGEATVPENQETEDTSGFAPETQTSTGEETPEDIDEPVTVIDISEH